MKSVIYGWVGVMVGTGFGGFITGVEYAGKGDLKPRPPINYVSLGAEKLVPAFYAAPDEYRDNGIAIVQTVDATDVISYCGPDAAACKREDIEGRPLIIIPNPCAYEKERYASMMCHEFAHVNGWKHQGGAVGCDGWASEYASRAQCEAVKEYERQGYVEVGRIQ